MRFMTVASVCEMDFNTTVRTTSVKKSFWSTINSKVTIFSTQLLLGMKLAHYRFETKRQFPQTRQLFYPPLKNSKPQFWRKKRGIRLFVSYDNAKLHEEILGFVRAGHFKPLPTYSLHLFISRKVYMSWQKILSKQASKINPHLTNCIDRYGNYFGKHMNKCNHFLFLLSEYAVFLDVADSISFQKTKIDFFR